MTTIDVQPSIYYTAASALHTSAVNLYNAFDNRSDALDQCGSMAGSYAEARSWAAGYDANAHQALQTMFTLAETMDAYAGTLRTIGYNHQLADWNATTGTKGDVPVKPTDPLPAVLMCRKPPPSAGGPGNGLSDAIHLAEKVGITIPDGDLDKLSSIAGTWTAMQTDQAISGLADGISRIISSVSLVKSPEATQIVEDLQGMKLSATTIAEGCGEIAQSCHSHHDDLNDLREKLKKQLEDLAKDLIEQEAITLAIGVAASFLTFGAGAVIAAARTAQLVEKFATPIREMVTVWIKAGKAKKEYDATKTLAGAAKRDRDLAARIKKAEADAKKEEKPPAKPANTRPAGWTNADETAVRDWTGGGCKDIQEALRADKPLTHDQQARLDAVNTAMNKCPVSTGWKVRGTHVPDDVLETYQEGATIADKGLTASSHTKEGAYLGGNNDVEMHIFSKSGRDVSQVSHAGAHEEEVLFKQKTPMKVLKRQDIGGRTILYLEEM
ncbi:hypothetical protein [Nocardia miyunensis]|uniref:hypothetical protein n=1 Tax=Nocardia miyunensis TaxID=282684 RepID=UPI000833C798|nr:hypothetical protein [Nocardia miyunensis]